MLHTMTNIDLVTDPDIIVGNALILICCHWKSVNQ
jgi:hypothetical protein